MKNQKGSAVLWVIMLLIVIIIAGVAYWYLTQNPTPSTTASTTELQTPQPNNTSAPIQNSTSQTPQTTNTNSQQSTSSTPIHFTSQAEDQFPVNVGQSATDGVFTIRVDSITPSTGAPGFHWTVDTTISPCVDSSAGSICSFSNGEGETLSWSADFQGTELPDSAAPHGIICVKISSVNADGASVILQTEPECGQG